MNSFTNRDYELYNGNYTSEYNTGLINPKINNFFNDVLSKPEPVYQSVIKTDYTWNKFYKDYIEHNLLFIVILIGIVIFLVIRYHTKDMDHDKRNNDYFDCDTDTDSDDSELDSKKIKKKLKKKYKTKFKKYKQELDDERNKVLNIIDELSNINYEDQSYNEYLRDNYGKQVAQLETQRKQDMVEQQRQIEELKQFSNVIEAKKTDMIGQHMIKHLNQNQVPDVVQLKSKNIKYSDSNNKNPLDHTIKNWDDSTDDDKSSFYNLKKYNKQNQDDFVNGLYIEAPYN